MAAKHIDYGPMPNDPADCDLAARELRARATDVEPEKRRLAMVKKALVVGTMMMLLGALVGYTATDDRGVAVAVAVAKVVADTPPSLLADSVDTDGGSALLPAASEPACEGDGEMTLHGSRLGFCAANNCSSCIIGQVNPGCGSCLPYCP